MTLPPELKQAIEVEMQNVSLRKLSQDARRLRRRYRTGNLDVRSRFVKSEEDVLAYAAYRLPSTYAAIYSVLTEVKARMPTWAPRSILEVGSGLGPGIWATTRLWPGINRATLIDYDWRMIALGKRLASRIDTPAISNVRFQEYDVCKNGSFEPHDLVLAAYLLGELPATGRGPLIERLWESGAQTVCVIEPAKSSRGFEVILEARRRFIEANARIAAPCPHCGVCPKSVGDNWCHFAQRVERSRLHRVAKAAFRPYEDEKFSYVAATTLSPTSILGRVTLQPRALNGTISLELCRPDGLVRLTVPKRDIEEFRSVRKLQWGNAVPSPEDSPLLWDPPHEISQ